MSNVVEMIPIHLKNGSSSIEVHCSPLSKLSSDSGGNFYLCEYGHWTYGLFAIVLVIMVVVPIALIIYCGVKCHNNLQKKRSKTNYSLESSFSSQYPASDGDLQTLPYDVSSCFFKNICLFRTPKFALYLFRNTKCFVIIAEIKISKVTY